MGSRSIYRWRLVDTPIHSHAGMRVARVDRVDTDGAVRRLNYHPATLHRCVPPPCKVGSAEECNLPLPDIDGGWDPPKSAIRRFLKAWPFGVCRLQIRLLMSLPSTCLRHHERRHRRGEVWRRYRARPPRDQCIRQRTVVGQREHGSSSSSSFAVNLCDLSRRIRGFELVKRPDAVNAQ